MLAHEEDFPPVKPVSENFAQAIPIISLPSSDDAIATTTPALPRVTADLPPRCRNEPAVLGCATGEVRRMRSVLDMKLGAMAVSPGAHLPTPDATDLLFPELENVVDKTPLSRRDQSFDIFGIAIPPATQLKMEREAATDSVYKNDSDYLPSLKSEGSCSLFLAESPSRLDLSALLC